MPVAHSVLSRLASLRLPRLAALPLLLLALPAFAQTAPAPSPAASSAPSSATTTTATAWTAAQDHADMLAQLGITKLRPGPSGRTDAPNAANYDPAKANPYPDLPELLVAKNGTPVTTPDQWWKLRRPEIVEDFEREVVGRIPAGVPRVTWEVVRTVNTEVGGLPVVAKQVIGRVDNSAHPALTVAIRMAVVTPAGAKSPVPALMMFGFGGMPGEAPPGRGGFAKKNPDSPAPASSAAATAPSPASAAPATSVASTSAAASPTTPAPKTAPRAAPVFADPPSTDQLIAAGWGYVSLSTTSIQADNGAGLTAGIIGLTNRGQPRRPDDWGALRAWAWGASRALDYLETDPAVDARRVGIEGVSRYGKAALVAMAFEPRFAVVLVGSSGEGGAKLHRRNFGEAVENLTGSGQYHWMAGNFLKYGTAESKFGSKNANDIPVDAHQLIALCAPRATFISYGIPERGDAHWLDQQGSYMATVAAGPAFRLLGVRDLGDRADYRTAQKPPVNHGLLDGHLAWRQHDGGHEDRTNMKHFISWANPLLRHTPPAAPTTR